VAKLCRRFFHDKVAITPVLSNLLLMIVAVAAMAIATTATYVITSNLRDTMSERIIVEDFWFNNPSYMWVYLRNVGKVAVYVSAVYVNEMSSNFTGPFSLEIGASGWLNISYSWTSGSLYDVNIVTTRGTHVGGYYEAP
jgi:hypothetical protein